jgi:ribosomal protein S18 acetylase RimI-like enzyme
MPTILRPPRPGDLDRLAEIETAAFSGDRLSRRSLRRLMSGASSFMVVAEIDGCPAGYALVLLRRGTRWARLYSIAVDPARTGRGLGTRLLAAAEEKAVADGRRVMRLEVRADNGAAIALYRGKGYTDIGRIAAYYEDGGEALRMEKQLRAHETRQDDRLEAAR